MEKLRHTAERKLATWNITFRRNYDKYVDPLIYEEQVIKHGRDAIAQHVALTFIQYLPDSTDRQRILDIATGTGLITKSLTEQGFDVIGADLSKNFLSQAQKQNKNVPLVRNNMNNGLPFADNSFEGVTSVWANRFISNPGNFISEVHRVLKEDGIFAWPIFPTEGLLWKQKAGVTQPTQISSLTNQLKNVGFKDVRVDHPSWKELVQEHHVHAVSVYNLLIAKK
jgi:ubiquinone/menaquinone biosynthesis C-methylase UbiE